MNCVILQKTNKPNTYSKKVIFSLYIPYDIPLKLFILVNMRKGCSTHTQIYHYLSGL